MKGEVNKLKRWKSTKSIVWGLVGGVGGGGGGVGGGV